jgi:hypothetical protein
LIGLIDSIAIAQDICILASADCDTTIIAIAPIAILDAGIVTLID